ncbi:glutamate racemase [Corynebacterium diphtheriae bv. mitis]|uniref:Glutamate racemase n=2 Tax=Corynebacterium diphtheriae TaxID=1717 RepID=A0A811G560_CORDP|nr:glutamate racemase [Corynebacterium diphtheriae]ERA52394.1 glutamate racemase [Corynebacterium diphtheriae DSM 43988]OWN09471.1 glutamate racemase [Corynebacterium belfantii]AEX49339.1 glutamate racemase [Corynebacterium diphtheriae BH8]AEX68004.1 glutamate racemase [Corynebacterium diphtheriae C7 (beta)]AEX79466.1 glutamate racemase [Corynebacterium diphtheriae HC03]
MNNAPIGIFDSGVGGLTVARVIMEQLPNESVIYIGDTANSPYGPKPIAQVRELSLAIGEELVRRGCKMIVIACNTATSAALRDLRERFDVPVLGVILPAVRRAVSTTRNGKIGVIGTEGTIKSGAYQELFAASPSVEVHAQACPSFVSFVERGITSGRQILGVAQGYVEPLQAAGVDTLVLGCTHYPLLTGVIQLAMGDRVTLVSSAEETAKDVFKTLSMADMLASEDSTPVRTFESTGDPVLFAQLAERFLGPHVTNVEKFAGM